MWSFYDEVCSMLGLLLRMCARSCSDVSDPEQPPSAHWEYLSFSVLVSSSFRRGSFLTANGAKMKEGPVGACAGI